MLSPRDFAVDVTRRLQAAGFEALWAGGCVRDQLMGFAPKDYDVATNARPDDIRDLFGRRRTLSVGAAFGVITVLGPKSAGHIEVATFRRDDHYSDGRHPDSVSFSTAEQDALRRDFTINGIFYDPVRDEIIDYVEGQRDIERRIVRAIGDPNQRFDEDKLRLLRAVRFAATLEFELEPETKAIISKHAAEIVIVSAERIAGEMQRMLLDPHRSRAFTLLWETGLLEQIMPEAKQFEVDAQRLARTVNLLDRLDAPSFAVALAALVHEIAAAQDVDEIGARWRLPNHVTQGAAWILRQANQIREAKSLPWSVLQPILVDPRVEELLGFVDAQLSATGRDSHSLDYCRSRLAWPAERLNPPPLIDGRDLIGMGFRPGPAFAQAIQSVRDSQLDGHLVSKSDALKMARKILQSASNQ